MTKNYGRSLGEGTGRANSPLHPPTSVPPAADRGDVPTNDEAPTWRRLVNRDFGASMNAWRHLCGYGLTSPLVCRTLFSRWSICACGRCLSEAVDDGR